MIVSVISRVSGVLGDVVFNLRGRISLHLLVLLWHSGVAEFISLASHWPDNQVPARCVFP